MSRLVIVSNRVAMVTEGKTATGGLAIAVLAALREVGGIWFGWSGELTAAHDSQPRIFETGNLTYATVSLNEQDYEQYYNGFANSTLWPLFHYRLDQMSFKRSDLTGYLRVNSKFVSHLIPLLLPDDTVWVHDYHLIPIAELLRGAGFEGRIGFFLHTPLPPYELLVTLPCHADIVRSLCAYDVIGFQTERDLQAFRDYIALEANGKFAPDGTIEAYGRRLKAAAYPIGIDTDNVVRMAQTAARSNTLLRLRQSIGARVLLIGVDRLDYSKGLVERFEAFGRLLRTYPQNRNRATFLQIAPPTRADIPEYNDIRRKLEETAGHVNGQYAEFDWAPIRYLNRGVQRRTLTGFFRLAQVGLVTPMRDGMNLVAKEYVASQDPDDPGVLVLSRFAGAAQQLTEALLVNPFDVDDMAQAMQTALDMPLDERVRRWRALMDNVTKHDVGAWRRAFLADLRVDAAAAA
jgi:trehalose 6-phosphate synthase